MEVEIELGTRLGSNKARMLNVVRCCELERVDQEFEPF